MRNRIALACALALGVTGCSSMHAHNEKEEAEGNEVKVTLDQVPPAAKASLMYEAKGNPIGSVDKEERKGTTVYEADVKINGVNWEIIVDGDGKVVSKRIDKEEDAKPAKKEEKEEDEKK